MPNRTRVNITWHSSVRYHLAQDIVKFACRIRQTAEYAFSTSRAAFAEPAGSDPRFAAGLAAVERASQLNDEKSPDQRVRD
jgi:hypothetical protein